MKTKKLTRLLVEAIEKRGYKTVVNLSKNDFGSSDYIYVNVLGHDKTFINIKNAIKIRISDHPVSNIDRIFNEFHIRDTEDFEVTKDAVINHLNFYYKRNEFFIKKDCTIETTATNVEANINQLLETDLITSACVKKYGRKVFRVTRTYQNSAICYINKVTGKIYKTILT